MTDPQAERIRHLEAQLARASELLRLHIMEREEAEEALRASEERSRALIDRAAYGIFLAAPDGRFIEVNRSLVAMLGYDDAETLRAGNVWSDVFHD
ncbi:MAG TPA: PAS domain-containing protein, partial [Gemmatimonadaceae bacterium]|nr:PAS domain-containing protein [Gemmatimonadaceae bacterium]